SWASVSAGRGGSCTAFAGAMTHATAAQTASQNVFLMSGPESVARSYSVPSESEYALQSLLAHILIGEPEVHFAGICARPLATTGCVVRKATGRAAPSFLLVAVLRHVAARTVILVGQELARHGDLDAIAPRIGQPLHLQVEIDRRHDAVAE